MKTVTEELALQKDLRKQIDALDWQIRPLERKRDKLCKQYDASKRRASCKKVPGCRGLRGHKWCHNV